MSTEPIPDSAPSARAVDGAEPHIVDRDDALLAVFKPAGLPVHRAGGRDDDLMTRLVAGGAPAGIAPIHRLDAPVSGLVLCSADPAVRSAVGQWFADRLVYKHYRALCIGRTRPKGIVRRPLADGRRGRPLEAVTRYRRIEWLGGFTLVAVRPETGRKHQIRRHLQAIGHPLVGDDRYGPRRRVRVPAFPGRLWLHALAVELPDGRRFEAPLPPRLVEHLDVLRAGARVREATHGR